MTVSAKKITELRKAKGWTQEKLAAISGISERTIQRLEKGSRCSLDTKLALANVFSVAPETLEATPALQSPYEVSYHYDWWGVLGLFIMGLFMMSVVLFTGTTGPWELASLAIVWGLTAVQSIISHGGKATYKLYDSTSWIVRYPSYVDDLGSMIEHAQLIISNSYRIGIATSFLSAVTLGIHSNLAQDDWQYFLAIIAKPTVYALVFCELWFRPYMSKMKKMLSTQSTIVK
ncbi:MAG: helix-turn-helix transcriptional regulator [Halieaceae bacterium]|nr:helix-turn-helix transcriptional regulator [Halieaceae bacterium]